MIAIYKRELKSFFCSFVGLLFIGVTLFYTSLYFFIYNLLNGSPYFSYVVSNSVVLFLLSIPVLTMKVLAEEKRARTDQLILTSPVSLAGIVVGKYLALVTIYLIPIAVLCIYPLIMRAFGTVPLGEAYLSIFAFLLYGMAALAIGMLVSSLTESQVIAAVLSFVVLFLGFIMSSICNLISSTGNLLTKILGCLDMSTPFSEMLNGTLNVKSIAYFLTVIVMALFLTVQSIQKRRYSVSVKTIKMGAYSTGLIAVALVVAVAFNMVIAQMPSTWTSIDLTAEKLYSLTDQTRAYLDQMSEDVTIYVISTKDSCDVTLKQTLENYESRSSHVHVEYVDPAVNPRFHLQYTDKISMNSLIVVGEKRNKVIDYGDIYETNYDYDATTGGYSSNTTGYDGEGQITSALDYVCSEQMPRFYMTEGHGESSLGSSFTDSMKKENVDYENINLMDSDTVPEDCAALIIYGPETDFSADDASKVKDYMEKGGNVILIKKFVEIKQPNVESLLSYMGLSLQDGLVVEQDQAGYYRNPYYLLPTQISTTYTAGLYGKYYVFAPFVQGITIDNTEAENMDYTMFLRTSDSSYAKQNTENLEAYQKEEGDVDGPFGVGVAAEKTIGDKKATLVAFGCSEMFTEDANSIVSGANQMLFANTISGFVDHEASISVPVKSYAVSSLMVAQSKAVLLGLLTVVLVPLFSLALGFIIWFRRRKY